MSANKLLTFINTKKTVKAITTVTLALNQILLK